MFTPIVQMFDNFLRFAHYYITSMETMLLSIHNFMRWIILLAGIYACYRAFTGWQGKKAYTGADNKSSLIFTLFCHMQLVMGFIMYFLSSHITKSALNDFGAAMKNADLRFWAVEHPLMMIIAVVLVTIGRSKSKRATQDISKHKTAFWFFAIAMLLMLAIARVSVWP